MKKVKATMLEDYDRVGLKGGDIIYSVVHRIETSFSNEDAIYYNGKDLILISLLSKYADVEYYEE